jgi:hypothetical protein
MTERVITTVPNTRTKLGRAPINQFAEATTLPNGSYTDVVLPSTSTLYASAFLNLSAEPIILHIPEIKDRFFLTADVGCLDERQPGVARHTPE